MSKSHIQRRTEPGGNRCTPVEERRNPTLRLSPLDYISYKVLSYAFMNRFAPPFQLQLLKPGTDAVLRETQVTVRGTDVLEEVVSVREGNVCFPLECKLVDRNGRTHEIHFSNEEIRKVFEAILQMEEDGLEYTFHETGVVPVIEVSAGSPEFSREVHGAVIGMLIAAVRNGFNSPFEIEVREAQGQVQGRSEVDFSTNSELRETGFANCSHGMFPMTISLVDRDGRVYTGTVERRT